MHMTQGWTGLRTAVIALAIIAGTTTAAKADALVAYTTAGAVDTSIGVNGANVISFEPTPAPGSGPTSTIVDATSNLPIGAFEVAALPVGTSTTYTNTPFSITYIPSMYNGSPVTGVNPVTITGTLTGTISGPYQSSVEATFNPVTSGSFTLGGASSTLSILDNQKLLVPSSAGGLTTVEAVIATIGGHNEAPAGSGSSNNNVPEPSTIALFLSTMGGLGLRRLVRNRRARAQA
jgi:hypothetical protein